MGRTDFCRTALRSRKPCSARGNAGHGERRVRQGGRVIVTDSDDDMRRLVAVIDRQRRELDRIRAAAAGESVVAMARGALMERLGLSSAEAASQLAELSSRHRDPAGRDGRRRPVRAPEIPWPVARGTRRSRRRTAGHGRRLAPSRRTSGREGRRGRGLAPAPRRRPSWRPTAPSSPARWRAGPEPLGATAVVLWLLEADGALALLGEAGLSSGEASRWRHIPPQLDCPAQRVARGAADLWWPAGRRKADRAPVTGHARRGPGGPRAARAERRAARRDGGQLAGAARRPSLPRSASSCRPWPRAARGSSAPASRTATWPPRSRRPAVYTLLDGLAESVLVAQAIRDDGGRVTDFSIEHVSPGFRDPAGPDRGRT